MADRDLAAQLVIGARVGGALAGIGSIDVKLGQLGRQVRYFSRVWQNSALAIRRKDFSRARSALPRTWRAKWLTSLRQLMTGRNKRPISQRWKS